MPRVRFSYRLSLGRALVPALVVCLMPLATAYAQSNPLARVANEEAVITVSRRVDGRPVTLVQGGALLEVLHAAGDQYAHRDTNWYLVLLPPDLWGRRQTGWISGRFIEGLQPGEAMSPMPTRARAATPAAAPVRPPQPVSAPAPMARAVGTAPRSAAPAAVANQPEVREIVLHFEFDQRGLTEEATSKLNGAAEGMMVDGQAVSFALEGHADWTGPDAYNERLGLARAETVKTYLVEQHHIPADRITVVSYGESQPVAPNTTREGRAQNRRVLVKVGG